MNKKLLLFIVVILIVAGIFVFSFSDNKITGAVGEGGPGGPPPGLGDQPHLQEETPVFIPDDVAGEDFQQEDLENIVEEHSASTPPAVESQPGSVTFGQGAAQAIGAYRSKHPLSNAFFEANDRLDYREKVDRFFATNYLGVEYYVSAICAQWYPVHEQGTANIETPEGSIQFVGHVEGDRSEALPIDCQSRTECVDKTHNDDAQCENRVCQLNNQIMHQYFYKLSGSVRAPSDQEYTPHADEGEAISFTIVLKGEGLVVPIFLGYNGLQNGELWRLQLAPFYSSKNFNQICIWFGKRPSTIKRNPIGQTFIPLASYRGTGQDELVEEICNSISATGRSLQNFQNNPGSAPPPASAENVNPEIY